MGLDLKLLVLDGDDFSHTVMPLDRQYTLFDCWRCLKGTPVPSNFTCYMGRTPDGERAYGGCTVDPYGESLTMVSAGDLVRAGQALEFYSAKNTATIAYLNALQPETLVALYWC